jgi:hypothetical protein
VPVAVPGVVYTPRAITAPMVRRALGPLPGDVRSLRVCDPAVGEGAFLLEAIDFLAAKGGVSKRLVAETCVFGVDIDARAVANARDAIAIATGARLTNQLRVADALACEWPQRFDAVIGNPPYIRQELLADKGALRRFEAYDGVADLYVYFVELAHRLLAPGGRWCLVVPNKWLTAAYGRPLRAYLARHGCVEGLVDLSRAPALFAADAFPCVVWGTRDRASGPIRATRGDLAALDRDGVPHERWRAEPWHVDTAADRALIARLEARWPALGDVAGRPARGIVTGCNRAFVIDEATRARLDAGGDWIRPLIRGRDIRPLATTRDRYLIVVDHGTPLASVPRAIRDHLAAFRDALEPRPAEHRGAWHGRKPGTYAWYQLQDPVGPLSRSRAPRMFYQDIQTQPACYLDATGALVPDTTVWALPCADPMVLAVLSSSLYRWYAQRRFPPALNGAVRPKLAYIRALPIATGDARIARLIERRDLAALDAAVLDAYALTDAERVLLRTAAK